MFPIYARRIRKKTGKRQKKNGETISFNYDHTDDEHLSCDSTVSTFKYTMLKLPTDRKENKILMN
jgi:hypothetical protein